MRLGDSPLENAWGHDLFYLDISGCFKNSKMEELYIDLHSEVITDQVVSGQSLFSEGTLLEKPPF